MTDEPSDSDPDGFRDIPCNVEHPRSLEDKDAKKEDRLISSNRYEEEGKERDHRRSQGLKDIAYLCLRILIIFALIIVILAIFAWSAHTMAPPGWRWLTVAEIDRLQTILFSGAFSAAITLIGKKLF